MKKFLMPILGLVTLASCGSNVAQPTNSLPSEITESFITESIISETIISEEVISEEVIVENPIRKAYIDSTQNTSNTLSNGYNEFTVDADAPTLNVSVSSEARVDQYGVGYGLYHLNISNFKDPNLTLVALVTNNFNNRLTFEEGWINASMGYALEQSFHYEFINSIGAVWYGGNYFRYNSPENVRMSSTTMVYGEGTNYMYLTIAYMKDNVVKFLTVGYWTVYVQSEVPQN
jgi:hypothetical protein